MSGNPRVGEQVVGAYHDLVTECEVISYNQRSRQQGDQLEIDVIAIDSDNGSMTVRACEVVTHLNGMDYGGNDTTLEKLEDKFESTRQYLTDVFEDANSYVYEIWSPYVPEGALTEGLEDIKADIESRQDERFQVVVNEGYTDRVGELQRLASKSTKKYGNQAFRLMQVLGNLRGQSNS